MNIANGQRNKEDDDQTIHLVWWNPEPGWNERILHNYAPEGVEVSTSFVIGNPTLPLAAQVASFVQQTRQHYPFENGGKVPLAAQVLACLKYESPLPAELWRSGIFAAKMKATSETSRTERKTDSDGNH